MKWLIRKITGKCEILRITLDFPFGAKRTRRIEKSLSKSKSMSLRNALQCKGEDDLNATIKDISSQKFVNNEVYMRFKTDLKISLIQILGYQCLLDKVEKLRKTKDCAESGDMLREFWSQLKPDTKLTALKSSQWEDVGFQGDDPMTDFRGMGMLALNNLVFFVRCHVATARQTFSHSLVEPFDYSFAIVGINMTDLTFRLLEAGYLKNHFYNTISGEPDIDHFSQVFCYIFVIFDEFWIKKRVDITKFNSLREKFNQKMRRLSLKDSAKFSL